jgi:hypothetical protein
MDENRQFSVMMARFPGNAQEHPRSAGYYITLYHKLMSDPRISRVLPFTISDTPITMTRNFTVKVALAKGADYILMLDSDMDPDVACNPDDEQHYDPTAVPFWDVAWEFMMERRAREDHIAGRISPEAGIAEYPPATIAAPYCGPPPEENVYVADWQEGEAGTPCAPWTLAGISRGDAARRVGIHPVAALPTGLILYDARVFQLIPKPWYDYEWADEERTRKATTEDYYQTRNASMAGLPQLCAFSSWAGHIKQKTVGKPRIIYPDQVADRIVEAVESGRKSDVRLAYVNPQDAPARSFPIALTPPK